MDCVDASTCVAVGYSGTILRTTDGGATWSSQDSGAAWSNLNDVDCVDANNCWAVGTSGTILKNTNGGASWASQTGVTLHSLNTVAWPLTITVRYSDADVAGVDESTLAIFRKRQGQWVALPTTVDAPNNTAASTPSNLSQFSLQGQLKYWTYLPTAMKQLAAGW